MGYSLFCTSSRIVYVVVWVIYSALRPPIVSVVGRHLTILLPLEQHADGLSGRYMWGCGRASPRFVCFVSPFARRLRPSSVSMTSTGSSLQVTSSSVYTGMWSTSALTPGPSSWLHMAGPWWYWRSCLVSSPRPSESASAPCPLAPAVLSPTSLPAALTFTSSSWALVLGCSGSSSCGLCHLCMSRRGSRCQRSLRRPANSLALVPEAQVLCDGLPCPCHLRRRGPGCSLWLQAS